MPNIRRSLLVLTPVFLLLGVGLLTVQSPSLVLWKPLRAMVLESDDWGLAGFVPSAEVWDGVNRERVNPGHFPAVYWGSTLEDASMVEAVCRIMSEHVGADGLPAVFQPNYVLSSLSCEMEGDEAVWTRHDLPNFPSHYPRPGMWQEVRRGIAAGLWYPEFHAAWHYDPQQRRERGLSSELARRLTLRGVTLFPGSEEARELSPSRSLADLSRELDTALDIFEENFGRAPGSIIAPDYTWFGTMERLWLSRDLDCIQAKREQRNPTLPAGQLGRGLKFVNRQLARVLNRDRVYLERNCRLEPVQAPDPEGVVNACVADAVQAWRRGQPAIVEIHRVNVAHTDPAVVRLGQSSLKNFLTRVEAAGPLPTYLSDTEVAQLQTRGVSAVYRGNRLILRNGTRSRRLIAAPPRPGHEGAAGHLFALAGGQVLVKETLPEREIIVQ